MKISVIYKIVNKITGKVLYVGQTIDYLRRCRQHLRKLRKGTHPNKKLQVEYLKYGDSAFVWTRLQFCDAAELSDRIDLLCARERYWEKKLRPTCNNLEPPQAIRRNGPRFDPFLQQLRRGLKKRRLKCNLAEPDIVPPDPPMHLD
jgi:group I intron endonuclease